MALKTIVPLGWADTLPPHLRSHQPLPVWVRPRLGLNATQLLRNCLMRERRAALLAQKLHNGRNPRLMMPPRQAANPAACVAGRVENPQAGFHSDDARSLQPLNAPILAPPERCAPGLAAQDEKRHRGEGHGQQAQKYFDEH